MLTWYEQAWSWLWFEPMAWGLHYLRQAQTDRERSWDARRQMHVCVSVIITWCTHAFTRRSEKEYA
jgi:hypothetical protein